jgi:hypothetical protein
LIFEIVYWPAGGGCAFRGHVVAHGRAKRLSGAKAASMILSCHDSVSGAAGVAMMRPVTVNHAQSRPITPNHAQSRHEKIKMCSRSQKAAESTLKNWTEFARFE